jgi:hypothetical protein
MQNMKQLRVLVTGNGAVDTTTISNDDEQQHTSSGDYRSQTRSTVAPLATSASVDSMVVHTPTSNIVNIKRVNIDGHDLEYAPDRIG